MKNLFSALLLLCSSLSFAATQSSSTHPQVILHTNQGDITIELYEDKAPVSVANFLQYAESGFYNNTIFHRVVKRFVIQGGGFDTKLKEKPNGKPIVNESGNGLHNDRWTVAMARTMDPNSATSQFYINMRMNGSLDSKYGKPGYAVFGKVIDGFHVVQDINRQPIRNAGGALAEMPVNMMFIKSVTVNKPATTK